MQNITREARCAAVRRFCFDVDMVNAYPTLLNELTGHRHMPLHKYCLSREEVLSTTMRHYGVDKDSAKQLYLRLVYGGSIRAWRRDHFVDGAVEDLAFPFDFQLACTAARDHILMDHAWAMDAARKFCPGRRTPEWTALSISRASSPAAGLSFSRLAWLSSLVD